MKRLVLSLLVLSLLGLGGQSFAELCTIDEVPAATLLLPYFEVDLDDPNGVDTLFSINNASAAPTIAHVVFWTDWSIPTIDFDIFLTGYDVETVRLRDVFAGTIPVTAHSDRDPADTISPHGNNPDWDSAAGQFSGPPAPNCFNFFPFPDPAITGTTLSRLVNGHTGNPHNGACFGDDHGDNIARGYITIDNADRCSLEFPSDPGYWGTGGIRVASNVNQLWGDYFYVEPGENFAQGNTLVHIEAHDDFDDLNIPVEDPRFVPASNTSVQATNVPNTTGYTFYGRYLDFGEDNREPLGTTWGVRYILGAAFGGGTELVVWRDSTTAIATPSAAFCGGEGPAWFPLNETEVVAFDEEEDAVEICFFQGGFISPPEEDDPACFPYEAGRYTFGDDPLDVPFENGWVYLNLNLPPGDTPFGTLGDLAQSYVSAIYRANDLEGVGTFSVGLQAVQLTDACQDLNPSIVAGNTIPQF